MEDSQELEEKYRELEEKYDKDMEKVQHISTVYESVAMLSLSLLENEDLSTEKKDELTDAIIYLMESSLK